MRFFSVAHAQVDEVASPTIPFTPPQVPTPTGGVVVTPTPSGPSALLFSDVAQLNVSDRIKVRVVLDSEGNEVREYNLQIIFNPELLQVVDFNPQTSNIEVDFQDTFFLPIQNSASQINGVISIAAQAPDSSAIQLDNLTVAEIEFIALAPGFTEVELVEVNSLLVNSNSINILESTNSLAFTILEFGVTPNPSQFPGTSVTPLPSGTPNTALLDDLGIPRTILVGVFFMISGFYILKYRKKARIRG